MRDSKRALLKFVAYFRPKTKKIDKKKILTFLFETLC